MKFISWLIGTLIIQPLIFLAIWNVLAVPMFRVEHTTFGTCIIIAIVVNLVCTWFRAMSKDY